VRTIVYVCETCRVDTEHQQHSEHCAGELFAQELQWLLEEMAREDIVLRRMRCLMACSRSCTVHLRAPGKIGYVIGDFAPTRDSAETLLAYACQYQDSADGQVAYRAWPEAIKGHFIARIPPPEPGD